MLAVRRSSEELPGDELKFAVTALDWHFAGLPRNQIVTRSRQFPGHMRADVQIAIDKLLADPIHFFGIHEEHRYETLDIAALMKFGRSAPAIAPPQYQDVDIGEAEPVKCLVNGLWLCRSGELRYAVLLAFHRDYGREPSLRIELAVPAGAAGNAFVQRIFAELESTVDTARSYRGKILSLDGGADYRGRTRGGNSRSRSPAATRTRSAEARASTRSQACGLSWRNSRMVGYQGVSSRSRSQRQSSA